ncbi:IS3 family transposase [Streptomyces sp. 130]|uniref:IS3 family transposase n=1 Tax=Streptomyces sp. 130 TaxID=2591006 RepID=UPI0021B0F81B|nr:IS3 family transposase [Streptomyces sp. 130]
MATSTYYAARKRAPSARSVRDAELKTQISRVHSDNFSVYGVRKVWRQLHREGIPVARCTVARLMRDLGLQGVRRGRGIRTTVRDDGHDRADDLLERDFTASRPNERWVADFTYVATWSGIVYVAFVVDVFSRAIVGWSAATSKPAKLVLDALDMALWRRDRAGNPAGPGLIHHSSPPVPMAPSGDLRLRKSCQSQISPYADSVCLNSLPGAADTITRFTDNILTKGGNITALPTTEG